MRRARARPRRTARVARQRLGAHETRDAEPAGRAEQQRQAAERHRTPQRTSAMTSSTRGIDRKPSSTRIITRVDAAADVARDESVRGAERDRQHDRERRDAERDPRAAHHARQQVAAELVRAERMRPRRRRVLQPDDVELLRSADTARRCGPTIATMMRSTMTTSDQRAARCREQAPDERSWWPSARQSADSRMRGSIAELQQSASRLPTTTITAPDDDRAPSRRRSRAPRSHSWPSRPRPGHWKTFSTNTAPPRNAGSMSPRSGDHRRERVAQRVSPDHAPARRRLSRAPCE